MKRRARGEEDEAEPADASTFDERLTRVRRNWIILAIIGLVGAFSAFDPRMLPAVLVLFFVVVRWNPAPLKQLTRVRASRARLDLGGVRIPREALRDGFVVPGARGTTVLFHRPFPSSSITLAVRDSDEGQRLLTALGLDAAHSVVRIRAGALPRGHGWFHALLYLTIPAIMIGASLLRTTRDPALLIAAGVALLCMILCAVIPSSVVIGSDGIEIAWLGQRRFVRYADVAYVGRFVTGFGSSRVNGIEITLQNASNVRIPVAMNRSLADRTEMVLERIREAMTANEARGSVAFDAEALARGKRDVDAWVRALRGLGAGANASMRAAPIDRDKLWRAVENPQLDARARGAAAVALGGDLDDDGRARLLAASKGVAALKLRVAIEAATTDDEAAMGAALADLEAEDEAIAAQHARA